MNREDVFHYRNFDFSEYIGGGKDIDLNQLFKMELVEYYGDDFKDKEHIVLTNKAIIELLGITEAYYT